MQRLFFTRAFFFLSLILLPPPSALAAASAGSTAQLIRASEAEKKIHSLMITQGTFPISYANKDGKLRPFVQIKGRLLTPGTRLFVEEEHVLYPVVTQNQFSIYFYLNGVKSELKLLAKMSDGTEESEKMTLYAPAIQEIRIHKSLGTFYLYLGSANLKYSQTLFGDFASTNLLFGAAFHSNPIWYAFQFHSDLEATFWTLRSTPVNLSPQALRANLYGTVAPSTHLKKFHFKPLLGIQYLTLLSNGATFGFSNLIAPEYGIHTVYDLSENEKLTLHFAYIPLNSILSFSEIGYDLSLGYERSLENSHHFEVLLGNTNDHFQATPNTVVSAGYLYLKFGYSI